jgi:hypothetical protein
MVSNETIINKAIELFNDRYEWSSDLGHSYSYEQAIEDVLNELNVNVDDLKANDYLIIEKKVRQALGYVY